jgi:folate-binding protein YgfZ
MTAQNSIPASDAWQGAPPGYRAARLGRALFDRSDAGRLLVAGADRASWLQGLLTNDIAALAPGSGCYAAYLTPQGRMISDMRVLALEAALLLDVPAAALDRVRQRFEQFIITEDVTIADLTGSLGRLAVHGPGAAGAIAAAAAALAADAPGARADAPPPQAGGLEERLAALGEHEHLIVPVPDALTSLPGPDLREARPGTEAAIVPGLPPNALLVAATRELDLPGFDLYAPPPVLAGVRRALIEAGAVEADRATWHVLRLEAGTPAFGIDMDEDTIPLEAGIEHRAISFTKGCYVGQEVVVRVLHRGHGRVARRLVGLAAAGSEPGAGSPAVSAGDVLVAGDREAGRVTSAAFSPRLGRTVALGYVHRDLAGPGSAVQARHDAGLVPLTVVALPFA